MQPTGFTDIFILGAALSVCEYIFRLGLAAWEFIKNRENYPREKRAWCIIKYSLEQDVHALGASGIFILIAIAVDIAGFFNTAVFLLPAYIALRILKYQRSLIDAVNWIREGSGIDYATGMASSYFHGFLNLQAVDQGRGVPGIRGRLEKYQDDEGVYVPVKRFFVLVPSSGICEPIIDDGSVKCAKAVEVVHVDRAGCKGRPYKTSVYSMTDEETGEKWYAAMEKATPVQTFIDAVNSTLTATPIMNCMKDTIILQFCKALKNISEAPQFRRSPVFDVIYYNDMQANGRPTLIGDVVKARIRELLRQGHN